MTTVSVADLARRVRVHGRRLDEAARAFLEDWRARGIAEQHRGGWRLTRTGRAMFSSWTAGIALEAEELNGRRYVTRGRST